MRLAYAFAAMGLGAAAVILAVMSLTAYYTLNILVRMARRYHINSYVGALNARVRAWSRQHKSRFDLIPPKSASLNTITAQC